METYQKISTVCLFILTMIAIAFVLSVTKTVLIPFIMAVFLALVFSPMMATLQIKLKLPRAIVLILTIVFFSILFLLVSFVTADSIENFASNSDQYKNQVQNIGVALAKTATQLGLEVDENSLQETIKKIPFPQIIKTLSSGVISLFSNTFLVIIFTIFLLSGQTIEKSESKSIISEIKSSVAKYVGTKTLISGATGILTFIVLKIFQVEMAFMFATLTFLLNFIPTIGSIVAVVLPLPILVLQFGFGASFFGCLALLGFIQIAIGNVLEPKLMGESTGLHPVTILLSLTFWGLLWGVAGMFLSVPITASLSLIFSKFELTQPIADVFAGNFDKLKIS